MEEKSTEKTTGKQSFRKAGSRRTKGKYARGNKNYHESKDEKFGSGANSTNDPSWYASDANLLRDSSSINFSFPTGGDVYGDITSTTGAVITPYIKRVPGICTLRVKPAFGNIGLDGPIDIVNPITTASKQVYSFVRHANSGHSNYDAPDLMLYILAMGDIYSYVVWCQRLYAYAMMNDARNKYLPRALINANQVDYDDLVKNLAGFRYWLNAFISKVTAFAIPATFSYMSRKAFLYKNLYIEGPSIKNQMYQLAPASFLQFAIDSTTSKGQLIYQDLPSTADQLMTAQDVENFGELLFKALWDQEDFGIMSGDILKAYGDNIIKLQGVDTIVPISPIMDEVVLTQFKNATVLPTKHCATVFDPLRQANNGELYGGFSIVTNNTSAVTLPTHAVLSINAADVTPEMVMEATRFMIIPYDNHIESVAMGTEVVVEVRYSIDPANTNTPFVVSDNFDTDQFNSLNYTRALFAQSQFDYAPKFNFTRTIENQQTGDTTVYWGMMFDIDNYAILDFYDLRKIHEAALLNMLHVPSVAKV